MSLSSFLLEVIFPSICVICGKWGSHVCSPCLSSLQVITKTPHHKHSPLITQYFSFWQYDTSLRTIVHQAKYNGYYLSLKTLTHHTLTVSRYNHDFQKLISQNPIIVPVPLHKHKQGSRGFNQAQIISQELCDFYHLKPPQNLLTRVKNTPSQTEFNRSKRQKNMKKAFQPNLKMKKLILDPKKPIILVDDVLTTGSTLNACARALNRLTKAEIYALTLGH